MAHLTEFAPAYAKFQTAPGSLSNADIDILEEFGHPGLREEAIAARNAALSPEDPGSTHRRAKNPYPIRIRDTARPAESRQAEADLKAKAAEAKLSGTGGTRKSTGGRPRGRPSKHGVSRAFDAFAEALFPIVKAALVARDRRLTALEEA